MELRHEVRLVKNYPFSIIGDDIWVSKEHSDNHGNPRLVLCDDAIRDEWFNLPDELGEMTVVLSTVYSSGTCYELIKEGSYDPDVLVEGESIHVVLFCSLRHQIMDFLEEHGKCYLSLEYEEDGS